MGRYGAATLFKSGIYNIIIIIFESGVYFACSGASSSSHYGSLVPRGGGPGHRLILSTAGIALLLQDCQNHAGAHENNTHEQLQVKMTIMN